jgi:hypothetical protein
LAPEKIATKQAVEEGKMKRFSAASQHIQIAFSSFRRVFVPLSVEIFLPQKFNFTPLCLWKHVMSINFALSRTPKCLFI